MKQLARIYNLQPILSKIISTFRQKKVFYILINNFIIIVQFLIISFQKKKNKNQLENKKRIKFKFHNRLSVNNFIIFKIQKYIFFNYI